jgi:inhibitor of KinA sporulation pathway (predicted exonuclease)
MSVTKFDNILNEFKLIPKLERKRNFLEISGYPHFENVSSNILKFYFHSEAEHNLKDLFLKSLFALIYEKVKETEKVTSKIDEKLIIEGDYYACLDVETEKVTSKRNRLDLLIETENFIIGIENKIYHSIDKNPLDDYSKLIKSEANEKKKSFYKLVLSLNRIKDQKIQDNGFINFTHLELVSKVEEYIGAYMVEANSDYLLFLKNYIMNIKNMSGQVKKNDKMNTFLEDNIVVIKDLVNEYKKFEEEESQNTIRLKEIIEVERPIGDGFECKIWICQKYKLVYDYVTKNGHKIVVEPRFEIGNWHIAFFGRGASKAYVENIRNFNTFNPKCLGPFNDKNTRFEDILKSTLELLNLVEDCIKKEDL